MEITPRRQRTRERLIEAALPVIAEDGVAGASIERISESAGMTRGAFYSNFSTKDDLLLAIIDRQISAGLSHVHSIVEGDPMKRSAGLIGSSPTPVSVADRRDAVTEAITSVFAAKALDPQEILAERQIELYVRRVPELQSKFDELVSTHTTEIAAVIEHAISAFGGVSRIPLDELVALLADVTKAAELEAVSRPDPDGRHTTDPRKTIRVLLAFVDFE